MNTLFQFSILLSIFVGYHANCHANVPSVYERKCCPTCEYVDACRYTRCRTGFKCYPHPDGSAHCCQNPTPPCRRCPYGSTHSIENGCPTCKCVPCREPKCPCHCPLGNELDRNGCKTCKCITPCDDYPCPNGTHCVTEYVGCFNNPSCGLRPKCVRTCDKAMCLLFCPYGFVIGCDGCPICKCREPCEGVVCPDYHKCVVQETFCIRPPCPPPMPYCESVCEAGQLLVREDGVPVPCRPSNVNFCGSDGKCVVIDEETGEHGCCIPIPTE